MFYSILYPDRARYEKDRVLSVPEYFSDLKLDIVVAAITKGRADFALEPLFYTPLTDAETIVYRQDVFRDLSQADLLQTVKRSAEHLWALEKELRVIRERLEKEGGPDNNYLTKGEFLDHAAAYCAAAGDLRKGLKELEPSSAGLRGLAVYLDEYLSSAVFTDMSSFAQRLKDSLSKVRYNMLIKNDTIRVRRFEEEQDLSKKIEMVFSKFKQEEAMDYRQSFKDDPHSRHMEAVVLDLVALQYREIFDGLNKFCGMHLHFMDETILRFAAEAQFYIAYHEYIRWMRESGLPFCYPVIERGKKRIGCEDGFDIALAKSMALQAPPVTNGFYLAEDERIIVVTGPNQSGKTTFARMFGQLHHLGMIGCCVPGSSAGLYLFDRIFTLFEREEITTGSSGKFKDDLIRLRSILDRATGDSLIIINEMLSSAALHDALPIGRNILQRIASIGAYGVCVTFMDELSEMDACVVSMITTVDKDDPSKRTFKIIRGKADGMAYAVHIAEKYSLTYDKICGRLRV